MGKKPEGALDKGLPVAIDCEKLILGAVLSGAAEFGSVRERLAAEDFAVEPHRKIFRRMAELAERAEKIDRITVCHALSAHKEIEAVGGLGYIVSLDDGMPSLPSIDSYCRLVKDKALLRRIISASQQAINLALSNDQDAASVIAATQDHLTRLSVEAEAAEDPFLLPGEVITRHPGGLQGFITTPKQGIRTSFAGFDEMVGGLEEGKVYVLGGSTSHGKSAFLINVFSNIAERDIPVEVFSLEMSKESLLLRVICGRAKVALKRAKRGWLTSEERMRMAICASAFAKKPLYIDDRPNLSPEDFFRRVQRAVREKGVKAVGLDYVQIMQLLGFKSRVEAITHATRSLKLFAEDLKIPLVVLSQLSRERGKRMSKDLRPKLGDLRESGTLENDGDVVVFVYRPELDQRDHPELKGLAELIVAKQRDGEIGTIPMRYKATYTLFEDASPASGGDE